MVSLIFESRVIGTGVLNVGLYRLHLNECVPFQIESDEIV